jgi:hypothetical protein
VKLEESVNQLHEREIQIIEAKIVSQPDAATSPLLHSSKTALRKNKPNRGKAES